MKQGRVRPHLAVIILFLSTSIFSETKPTSAKEKEWSPFIPSDPSPILHAMYDVTDEGQFWLSMGEFDAGYLYKCKFLSEEEKAKIHADLVDEPIQAIPVDESKDVPISTIKFR